VASGCLTYFVCGEPHPRLGRRAALLALDAAAALGFAHTASAATNWAANASADFDADHVTDLGAL
jgi:hypothetical protein